MGGEERALVVFRNDKAVYADGFGWPVFEVAQRAGACAAGQDALVQSGNLAIIGGFAVMRKPIRRDG